MAVTAMCSSWYRDDLEGHLSALCVQRQEGPAGDDVAPADRDDRDAGPVALRQRPDHLADDGVLAGIQRDRVQAGDDPVNGRRQDDGLGLSGQPGGQPGGQGQCPGGDENSTPETPPR